MKTMWTMTCATALLVALASCGGDSSSGEPREDGDTETITVRGVAALVDEHLGADSVGWYGTYGNEKTSVDLVIRMRGADARGMFVLSVMSPEGAEEEYGFTNGISCEQMERPGGRRQTEMSCEDLDGGGLAYVQLTPYGFSDDNRHGRVLSGMAADPDGRLVHAMYESYTSEVPVDEADLLALLTDERLAWQTDPAVNRAGQGVEVRQLSGG